MYSLKDPVCPTARLITETTGRISVTLCTKAVIITSCRAVLFCPNRPTIIQATGLSLTLQNF
jgi:hypothetical protein